MTNMINELLEFTRGTSRSAVLVPTDYRKFVENFLKEMIPEAGEKSVKIECENPPPALVLALTEIGCTTSFATSSTTRST